MIEWGHTIQGIALLAKCKCMKDHYWCRKRGTCECWFIGDTSVSSLGANTFGHCAIQINSWIDSRSCKLTNFMSQFLLKQFSVFVMSVGKARKTKYKTAPITWSARKIEWDDLSGVLYVLLGWGVERLIRPPLHPDIARNRKSTPSKWVWSIFCECTWREIWWMNR